MLLAMGRRRNCGDDFGPFSRRDVRSVDAWFGRLDRRAQVIVVAVVLLLATVAALLYWRSLRRQAQGPAASHPSSPAEPSFAANMLLGNPSRAAPDPADRDNYLMVKPYYCLSYNNAAGTPNWVSWRVIAADLGDAPRKQVFDADTTFPPGFNIITTSDYTRSGFDRGHMCPHSDRAADIEMSYATFVMTNIVPQAPNVNQKAWAQVENYCRGLVVKDHQRLYITSGPVGRGGRGSKGFRETLGDGRVVVPSECWKVVVAVPDRGVDDLAQITASARVLTVIMPNDNERVADAWSQFRTSPAQVEQRTGLHFFDRLPPDVAAALRQKVDTMPLPQPRPLTRGRGPEQAPAY